MMSKYLISGAILLILVGVIFLGQGLGVIPGSFMSGDATWAVIGAVLVAAGLLLARRARL